MNNFTFIVIVFLILSLALVGSGFYKENERLHKDLIGKTEQLKRISDNAVVLENKYLEASKLKEKLEKEWAKEKDYLQGRLKVMSSVSYHINEAAKRSENHDLIHKGEKGFSMTEIGFKDGPPVGYVLIFDSGKIISKLYNFELESKQVISRDEKTGKYTIISKADYILKTPHLPQNENWVNKAYPLPLKNGTAYIDPTESNKSKKKFHWLAPVLNAGVLVNTYDAKLSLGPSIMGYGVSKYDLKWKFLDLGLDWSDKSNLSLSVTPFSYRLFDPFLKNTFVGPALALDQKGQTMYFLSIKVGL